VTFDFIIFAAILLFPFSFNSHRIGKNEKIHLLTNDKHFLRKSWGWIDGCWSKWKWILFSNEKDHITFFYGIFIGVFLSIICFVGTNKRENRRQFPIPNRLYHHVQVKSIWAEHICEEFSWATNSLCFLCCSCLIVKKYPRKRRIINESIKMFCVLYFAFCVSCFTQSKSLYRDFSDEMKMWIQVKCHKRRFS
jgi:hypothetical protein